MIKLKMDKPNKILRTKMSIYMSIPYDPKLIQLIKTIPKAYYHSGSKVWEVHPKFFRNVLDMFSPYPMEIVGDLTPAAEKELELADKFDSNICTDYTFKTEPFDHQRECFEYAMNHNKFLLGDEQGLGKTKQSIDIAVARKSNFKHCLIICCVNGLKWNWKKEVEIHSNEKAHILGEYTNKRGKQVIGSVKRRLEDLMQDREEFFLITNIETLRDKAIQNQLENMCKEGTIGMVIIDEIHKCKNSTSLQGKSIHKLPSYYKIALTGTPLMNSPIDLYNILKWLEIEHHTLTQFKEFYCVMGGFGGYEVVGYKHLKELQANLDQVMLRRRKDDVLDLPPKIRSTEYVEMSTKQAKLYEDIKMEILDNIDKVMLNPNPLVELIRLRQCTGCPSILSSTITDSAKLDRMLEIVEENVENGRKVIVFSNWTSVIGPAFEVLSKFNPAIITGETKDRKEQEARFQTDDKCKVILGTISAMGTGLTLTAGSTVIFLDSPWNKANKDQAEDRAHRIGTTQTVNIITLVAKNTIDERIENIVESKGEMADVIVDNFTGGKVNLDTVKFLLS